MTLVEILQQAAENIRHAEYCDHGGDQFCNCGASQASFNVRQEIEELRATVQPVAATGAEKRLSIEDYLKLEGQLPP